MMIFTLRSGPGCSARAEPVAIYQILIGPWSVLDFSSRHSRPLPVVGSLLAVLDKCLERLAFAGGSHAVGTIRELGLGSGS